ncbi:MAG: DUF2513 domain-containing protein [Clostridiales bacterium]|nr:DUF2513 domain-containing protein [Clostridiales bacterium]
MKLNPDCIRDILLHCEERCIDLKGIKFSGNEMTVNKTVYPRNVLWYHLRQCDLSGYLYGAKQTRNYYLVKDLMPKAHEILENIRNDKQWNKTKEGAGKIGLLALSAIGAVANVVSLIPGVPDQVREVGKTASSVVNVATKVIGKKEKNED